MGLMDEVKYRVPRSHEYLIQFLGGPAEFPAGVSLGSPE